MEKAIARSARPRIPKKITFADIRHPEKCQFGPHSG
jgi:hypothetical protein